MRNTIARILILVVVIVAAGGTYLWMSSNVDDAPKYEPATYIPSSEQVLPVPETVQQAAQLGDPCTLPEVVCPSETPQIINDHGNDVCSWKDHEVVGNQYAQTNDIVVTVEWSDGRITATFVTTLGHEVYVNGLEGAKVTVHIPDTCTWETVKAFTNQYDIMAVDDLMEIGILGGEIITSP